MSEVKDCAVRFEKATPGIKVYHESNDVHTIVLFSLTEMDIILKCVSATPKMITVLGLFKLNLEAGCSVTDEQNTFRLDSTYTMEKSYSFELYVDMEIPALRFQMPKVGQVLSMPEFEETGTIELSFEELEQLQDPFIAPPFFRGEKGTLRTVVITMSATVLAGIVCLILVKVYGVQVLFQKCTSCICWVCHKRSNSVFESTLTPDVATTGPGEAPTTTSMADSGLISFRNSFLPKVPAVTTPTAPFLSAPPVAVPTTPASAYPSLQEDDVTRL
jgi:hypothetical protein